MAKRKRPAKKEAAPAPEPYDFTMPSADPQGQIAAGGSPLHELFQQQVRQALDQAGMDEQAKQAILVALNCPCCGAGGMNYTAKIKRRT